jgi:hypothetical protein
MLYRSTTYPLVTLIHDIGRGTIGLPELQRPFVWPNTKFATYSIRSTVDILAASCCYGRQAQG